MTFIEYAFHEVCKEAKTPESWYVCLMEDVPYYGGSEEGGWWGHDSILVAFQSFPTEELANAARDAVTKLAEKLTAEAVHEHSRYCAQTMDWLDERGLDADYLPEPDGPSRFYVLVSEELPSNSMGPRHYE